MFVKLKHPIEMPVCDSYENARMHCTEVPRLLHSRGDIPALGEYVKRKHEP